MKKVVIIPALAGMFAASVIGGAVIFGTDSTGIADAATDTELASLTKEKESLTKELAAAEKEAEAAEKEARNAKAVYNEYRDKTAALFTKEETDPKSLTVSGTSVMTNAQFATKANDMIVSAAAAEVSYDALKTQYDQLSADLKAWQNVVDGDSKAFTEDVAMICDAYGVKSTGNIDRDIDLLRDKYTELSEKLDAAKDEKVTLRQKYVTARTNRNKAKKQYTNAKKMK